MEIDQLLGNQNDLVSGMDQQALMAWLRDKLLQLLSSQPERLAQICYQIDLDETVFRAALKMNPENGAELLADAFLKREMARRAWKKRYSGKS